MSRAMRALILYTADLFDRVHTGQKELQDEIAFLTPICKAYCSDEGFQVAVDAIQVHGGYGFCSEYGIEQFARDTKIATIYEGTNGIQAIDFTMRKVLKDNAKTFLAVGEKIKVALARPEAQEFKYENRLIIKNLEKAQVLLQGMGKLAKENRMDAILFHASSFLNFSGNLVAAWLLLEGACEASNAIAAGGLSEEDSEYYLSKRVDFKFFVQHQLVKNIAMSYTMINFEEDLSQLNV
jgi:hypothetical protein